MKREVYIDEMRDVVRRFDNYDASGRKTLYDFYDGQITGMKYMSWRDEDLSPEDAEVIRKMTDVMQEELRRLRHEDKSI